MAPPGLGLGAAWPSYVFCVLLLRHLGSAGMKECRLFGAKRMCVGVWPLAAVAPAAREPGCHCAGPAWAPTSCWGALGGPHLSYKVSCTVPMAHLTTGPGGFLEAFLVCQKAPGVESGLKA